MLRQQGLRSALLLALVTCCASSLSSGSQPLEEALHAVDPASQARGRRRSLTDGDVQQQQTVLAAVGQAGDEQLVAAPQAANTTAEAQVQRPLHVWLYGFVSAEVHGPKLLRHWIRHYLALGVPRQNFLLLLNHDPSLPTSTKEDLEAVVDVLQDERLNYRVWIGAAGSEPHLKFKLHMLLEEVTHMEDWVVFADADEFHIYPVPSLPAFLTLLEAKNFNHVQGFLQERVTHGGELAQVLDSPSIFLQFPLSCAAVQEVPKAKRARIAAAKAYLRTSLGDARLILPYEARDYFGPAKPGQESLRSTSRAGLEDLFPLTPYSKYSMRYWYQQYPPENINLGGNNAAQLWYPRQANYFALVQHFGWHAGALQDRRDDEDADPLQRVDVASSECSERAYNPES